jgi:hypothetical protein
MGLIPSNIKLLIKAHSDYNFGDSVLTLGNQEIWASYEDMLKIFNDVRFQPEKPKEIILHSSKLFNAQEDLRKAAKDFIHARTLFEMMGFKEYIDLDKYAYDKPEILHDMNFPVPDHLKNRFTLVLDGGTMEHIFDIRQSLTNIVNMVKVGGFVNHICSYHIDHGLYSINPCLLHDFYEINGFEIVLCYIQIIDYRRFYKTYKNKNSYYAYRYGQSFENLIHPHKQNLVFFIAKKIKQLPEIVIPTQGIFNEQHNYYQNVNKPEAKSIQTRIAEILPDFLYKFLLSYKPKGVQINKI